MNNILIIFTPILLSVSSPFVWDSLFYLKISFKRDSLVRFFKSGIFSIRVSWSHYRYPRTILKIINSLPARCTCTVCVHWEDPEKILVKEDKTQISLNSCIGYNQAVFLAILATVPLKFKVQIATKMSAFGSAMRRRPRRGIISTLKQANPSGSTLWMSSSRRES